jgi:hypothetical protein
MPNDVKCSVSNCNYWEQGNNCNAKQILIEVDKHASVDYNSEFASDMNATHQDHAQNVQSTCCHTFEAKQK